MKHFNKQTRSTSAYIFCATIILCGLLFIFSSCSTNVSISVRALQDEQTSSSKTDVSATNETKIASAKKFSETGAVSTAKIRTSTTSHDSLKREDASADFDIEVEIPSFFVSYFEDLFGIEKIDGVIESIGLQGYLENLDYVSNIVVSGQSEKRQETDIINVSFHSAKLTSTLDSLGVEYQHIPEENGQKIRINITRDFVESFLNGFEQIRSMDLTSSFLPDSKVVSQKDFSEYIAWSFSDYAETKYIKKYLDAADIDMNIAQDIGVEKDKNSNVKKPDNKKPKELRHTKKNFNFISVLFSEENIVEFSY